MASNILQEIRNAVNKGTDIAELQVLIAQNLDELTGMEDQVLQDFYEEMGGPNSDFDAALVQAVAQGEAESGGRLFGDPESTLTEGEPIIGGSKLFKAVSEGLGTSIFGKSFASRVLQSLEGGLVKGAEGAVNPFTFAAQEAAPGLLRGLLGGLSRIIYGPRGGPVARRAVEGTTRRSAIGRSSVRGATRVGGATVGGSIISRGIRDVDFSNVGTGAAGQPLDPQALANTQAAQRGFKVREDVDQELQTAERQIEERGAVEVIGSQIPKNLPDGFNVMIVDHTGQFGTPGKIYIINPSDLGLPFGGGPPGDTAAVGNTVALGGEAEEVFAGVLANNQGAGASQDFNVLQAIFPQGLGDISLQSPLFVPSQTRTTNIPDRVEGGEGITATGPASLSIPQSAEIAQRAFNTHQGKTLLELTALAAQRHGVPINILYGMIAHESDYDVNAVGKAAERGLAQIHPPSFPGITGAQAFNPAFALNFAAEKLRQRFNTYGSWEIAVAAHNSPKAAAHLARTGEFEDAKSAAYVNDILGRANRSGLGNNIWDTGEFGPKTSPSAPEFAPFQTPDPAQSREFIEATYNELLGRKPTEDEYIKGVKRIAALSREAYSSNVRIGSGSEATAVDPGAQFTQEIKGSGEFAFHEDVEQTDDFTDYAASIAQLLQQGV